MCYYGNCHGGLYLADVGTNIIYANDYKSYLLVAYLQSLWCCTINKHCIMAMSLIENHKQYRKPKFTFQNINMK